MRIEQPIADSLLLRDLKNIVRFFRKNGVETPEPGQLFAEIAGREPFTSE